MLLETPQEERATSKDRWWRPLLGGSRAELPGAGERGGDKGSLRGMRGGERFYSQGRCPSQVFPYKEESVGYSGGWCPRAPCRYLRGPGCRGSVPGSLASLWNLSVAFFQGIPQHARPFICLQIGVASPLNFLVTFHTPYKSRIISWDI